MQLKKIKIDSKKSQKGNDMNLFKIAENLQKALVDAGVRFTVDEYGRDVRNYTDNNGKQHGRSKADQKASTHFRILKREEM